MTVERFGGFKVSSTLTPWSLGSVDSLPSREKGHPRLSLTESAVAYRASIDARPPVQIKFAAHARAPPFRGHHKQ